MAFRELHIGNNPDCPLCGETPTITELIDYDAFCGTPPHCPLTGDLEITAEALRNRLATGEVCFIDVRDAEEWEASPGFTGARHIPYPAFTRRMSELDSSVPTVLYCSRGRPAVGTPPPCCAAPVLPRPGACEAAWQPGAR